MSPGRGSAALRQPGRARRMRRAAWMRVLVMDLSRRAQGIGIRTVGCFAVPGIRIILKS
jgi:hypothetical protein